MVESSANILNLLESAFNALKKSDLLQKILGLKEKVIVHTDLHKLSDQIHKTYRGYRPNFIRKHETYKWTGYHKICYGRLEERIINLEENQPKGK